MSSAPLVRNHGTFEGVARLRIQYRSWEVPKPRAALAIVHGLADHSGRYAVFAEYMAGCGFSTFALDLRGHGRSDGRRGHVRRFDIFLQELDRFRREVQGFTDPDCPLFLLGHSMGGLIALRYLEEFEAPLRGAILTAPWLSTSVPVPRWKSTLASALYRTLPALPFAAGIQAHHLSHDPQIVAAYREDPLVHDTITPRLFVECTAAMELVLQRSDRLRLPLLFLLPGDDRLADTRTTVDFARSLVGQDVTLRVFPDHFHEILNEARPEPVWTELRDWLLSRGAR